MQTTPYWFSLLFGHLSLLINAMSAKAFPCACKIQNDKNILRFRNLRLFWKNAMDCVNAFIVLSKEELRLHRHSMKR